MLSISPPLVEPLCVYISLSSQFRLTLSWIALDMSKTVIRAYTARRNKRGKELIFRVMLCRICAAALQYTHTHTPNVTITNARKSKCKPTKVCFINFSCTTPKRIQCLVHLFKLAIKISLFMCWQLKVVRWTQPKRKEMESWRILNCVQQQQLHQQEQQQ